MNYFFSILILMFCIEQCVGQDNLSNYLDSNLCLHGKIYKYFSNGKPKSFKTYEHGFLYGPYEKYYKNGTLKEIGFLDDVNEWTLLFQPFKANKEKYDKKGNLMKSFYSEIKPIDAVPYGKCQCEDGNIKRLKSLLVGTWVKEKMIPFSKKNKIIDSVFNDYSTEITFFENDSLSISINGIKHVGRYFLTSNTINLEMKNDKDDWESIISIRWPKKTLYPNSKREHFDLKLIEAMNILDEDENKKLSSVIIKFTRIE